MRHIFLYLELLYFCFLFFQKFCFVFKQNLWPAQIAFLKKLSDARDFFFTPLFNQLYYLSRFERTVYRGDTCSVVLRRPSSACFHSIKLTSFLLFLFYFTVFAFMFCWYLAFCVFILLSCVFVDVYTTHYTLTLLRLTPTNDISFYIVGKYTLSCSIYR